MGFLMKRSLPQKPIYFDRHPADQSLMMYSTPKKTTRQVSIQKRFSFANSAYVSIVDKTLNIKHTRTSMNLRMNVVINFDCPSFCHPFLSLHQHGRAFRLVHNLHDCYKNEKFMERAWSYCRSSNRP